MNRHQRRASRHYEWTAWDTARPVKERAHQHMVSEIERLIDSGGRCPRCGRWCRWEETNTTWEAECGPCGVAWGGPLDVERGGCPIREEPRAT